MDQEMRLRKDAAAGREAQAALALVGEHMEDIRAEAMRQIVSSKADHVAFRERMIVTCQILDCVKAALAKSVAHGTAANAQLVLAETVGLRR